MKTEMTRSGGLVTTADPKAHILNLAIKVRLLNQSHTRSRSTHFNDNFQVNISHGLPSEQFSSIHTGFTPSLMAFRIAFQGADRVVKRPNTTDRIATVPANSARSQGLSSSPWKTVRRNSTVLLRPYRLSLLIYIPHTVIQCRSHAETNQNVHVHYRFPMQYHYFYDLSPQQVSRQARQGGPTCVVS